MGYTNSPLVSYTRLSPNNSGLRTQRIIYITPHCVVGQVSVERLGEIFAPTSRRASCQYGIGADGRIGMYCEEKNRSWCSSSAYNDQRGVTIECASDATAPYAFKDIVYEKLIDLCVDICQRNGRDTLLWKGDKLSTLNYVPKDNEMLLTAHRWYANKSCPGDWMYVRMGDLADKVTKRLHGEVIIPTTPTINPIPDQISALVRKGFKYAMSFTGISDTNLSKVKARVLQHAMNLDYGKSIDEDGMFGPKSKAKLGSHYVKKGEKQYMVTAAEILMYLNNIDPNGVEYPGIYGNGLVKASRIKFSDDGIKITANEFLKLL